MTVLDDSKPPSESSATKVRDSELSKLPLYTMEEVAKHNTAHDLWLVIDDVVIDATHYLQVRAQSLQ